MSERETISTLQLARELVDHLPKEIDDKLRKLIKRAEEGQHQNQIAEMEIVELLSSHENIRRWWREQTSLESGDRGSYSPPPGRSKPILPSEKWYCPKNTCDQWTLVIQDGEDPPSCKRHNIKMVRMRNKKG